MELERKGIEQSIVDNCFYRSMEVDERAFDEEKREMNVSFSSETEGISRFFGIEVLSHARLFQSQTIS